MENQMHVVRLTWGEGKLDMKFKDAFTDVLATTKAAIIKTIEQELYPLTGMFDEVDDAIERFERETRGIQ